MTTDNKTLANVQPGGRVRLGDQAELDRLEFQAWARELLPCPFCGNSAEFVPYKDNGLTLKCKSMGCIQRNQRTLRYGIDWLRTSMAEHWNTRALSAQPSPGGQDALAAINRVVEQLEDMERGCRIHPDYLDDARLAQAALAARQPVGEPVELACVAETLTNGAGLWMTCSGCHESNEGAPTGPYSTIMQCHLGNGCDECGGIGAIWDNTDYQQMADEMAKSLAAPRAHTVDLSRFRSLARWVANSVGHGINSGQRRMGEELLALIDSQAVGISADWVLGYLNTDAPEESREAIRNAFAEYAAMDARQPVGEPLAVSRMVSTAPEKIFLQIGDGDYSDEPFPHPVGEEITWCSDSIVESEVAYVRADLAAPRAHTVDLSRFRSLARWVANSVGHGINSGQRRMGEELLALIDSQAVGK
ncbi:Lar family restriction alleviation protein [Stenotrophomonas maltophilia]|uniref:Lar family restriction alleviation protein n=1 Tax=Stenotrophomonas maltophilia TaxID=40324 RepID=UPI00209B7701|nr:Lar family restriction alleviation protein [Stenotrophomonas maltophilia]MCO7494751.1 Lar family restriction alleviation protein [Stenotrophomonas maltophilia]